MTKIHRKKMIERWVKDLNPNAILRYADTRLGFRCAVYVVAYKSDCGVKCTEHLPLEQLEQHLLGVFNANMSSIQRLNPTKSNKRYDRFHFQ